MRRPRRCLRTLFLFLASTLLTVVLAEVAFRVVHHFQPVFFLPSSDYNLFRATPGTMYYGHPVNSLGFYDREVSIRKPDGVFRILALGDSFAFGVVPYPDNYLTLLESHLDGERGRVEVVNMGIPRIGVAYYLAVLEHEGLRMEPDLVLLNFFVGNDFNLPPKAERRAAPPPRSFLWAFLRFVFVLRPDFEGADYHRKTYQDDLPTMKPERYHKVLRRKLVTFHLRDPLRDEKLRYVTTTLGQIRDLCTQRDIPLVVAILPDELQVNFALRQELFEAIPEVKTEHLSFQTPNRRLHRRLEYLGIPYLDLLPTFRAQPGEVPLYKPRDTHWNRHGNRLAADALAAFLHQGGWVPESE